MEHTQMQTHSHVEVQMSPTEPWLTLLDYPIPVGIAALLGTPGPYPVWLAGQCAVYPGGLKSQGLAAAAATDHSRLNSFPILTPGSVQSAASLGHSTTSS